MIRVNVDASSTFSDALSQVQTQLGLQNDDFYISNAPNSPGKHSAELRHQTIQQLDLHHGDILFVSNETQSVSEAAPVVARSTNGATVTIDAGTVPSLDIKQIQQLPLDDMLDKADGSIPRKKSSMCRHGDKGMCEYCSPLPPWDKAYLEEHKIKHKSFHAHLKEINEHNNNRNKSSSYIAPLTEPDYSIDLNCTSGHAPYPHGICSKCQPAPITLQQQGFRMVDHVEFADHTVLNEFIDAWRQTGMQRFGIFYGRYEAYDKVPLGIKAVVEAIYEPPQACELDGITLLEWEDQTFVDSVAESLGLCQVGMVFTDLTDSGQSNGSVLCKRHKDSFFLSCIEVLMASRSQSLHPNITKHSESGKYSSKFVTCVITGNLKGEIEPRVYQVSASAEALVKADDIGASTHPNMVCVKETMGKRYVPEVFFSKINEYGLEVKENAKPAFPVDFLLVTLLDSFPLEPTPMFRQKFPIENRDYMGSLQNLKSVKNVLNLGEYNVALSDFHFLVYVLKMGVLGESDSQVLLRYIKDKNDEELQALVNSGSWMTLLTILEHSD